MPSQPATPSRLPKPARRHRVELTRRHSAERVDDKPLRRPEESQLERSDAGGMSLTQPAGEPLSFGRRSENGAKRPRLRVEQREPPFGAAVLHGQPQVP